MTSDPALQHLLSESARKANERRFSGQAPSGFGALIDASEQFKRRRKLREADLDAQIAERREWADNTYVRSPAPRVPRAWTPLQYRIVGWGAVVVAVAGFGVLMMGAV
jgi:hypothetical protein